MNRIWAWGLGLVGLYLLWEQRKVNYSDELITLMGFLLLLTAIVLDSLVDAVRELSKKKDSSN